MNYNQNQRLNQLDENILIIGVDVSKRFHVARAQDFRGIEFKTGIKFNNSRQGFAEFEEWKNSLQRENQKTKILVGMEPTGPYWLPFARWLQTEGYWTVTVNPAHVKGSKELDDNNQAKTDYRDARVIAQLLKDARFSEPNLLEGVLVNKLLRIIHTIVVKNVDYDEAKMFGAIKHPDEFLFAA